ncbi:wax ester/triacylglycerol synthase domain-containing protein [Mycobacterium sp. 94-17]|uniref:wax ester/triacylglycerol synthase domain-containing protein n=1 Tax=Mycobacterium sp. 94-17 TaxID=2986147 RepID=UPI002D1EBEC9|nr:wax ester/triacylglycerol synthase domain-containing protein [Mycobacterium sp. 94-17]MEB4208302.1 WS/DGAT domain-containing protein [Mycobacterium sp. 94-17]
MAQTLDTAFLQAHDPDQHASLSIGAVAIVDGTAPAYETLKSLLAERIQPIPRCTQLLRAHPLSQEWIECPDFDLAHHLRRAALPRPGDEAELSRAIAYALERPLDLDRPPWECWVIEGLQGNRWAILMKTHHGLLDGNSAARLISRLCDDADADTFANGAAAKHVSPPVGRKPGWVDALWRASSAAGALAGAVWPAVCADAVKASRRYSTVRVPIADVDSVCRKFGVSANDVALAAITEGFRTALLGRGEEPRRDSLRTLAPMPVRSAMLSHLPVEHDDPVRRLQTVHARWQAKQGAQPRPAGIVESAIGFLPNVLRSNTLQLLSRLPQRAVVTLATNVPGPRRHLRVMGQTLERLLPIPPTATALHTGVAVLSYGDELVFGITAEHRDTFDVKQLAAGIELGMARLVALGDDSVLLFKRRRSPRALPRRVPRAHPSAY